MGSPPGGPERTEPPVLVRVTPDSGAVNVRADEVVFEFDAVVSDRPSGTTANMDGMFLISPSDGRPRVSWKRDRIEVRPRKGFRPNTAYSVTMLPGIADLRGNILRSGRTVVFSTGSRIPSFAVHGRVFDWMNERVAARALVEVIRRPDSIPYVGTSDSTGQFTVGPLEEGTYAVRAILDANNNRALDPQESWDSLAIVVRGSSPFVELLAVPRDTIGPRLLTVTVQDSVSLAASFDRPLDVGMPLTPASFRVMSADSARLTIVRVVNRAQSDTIARDTTTVAVDSLRRVAVPRPSQRPPARDVILRLDPSAPLRPGAAYRITAVNARGLLGAVRTSDRVITVPATRPDTAAPVRPPPA